MNQDNEPDHYQEDDEDEHDEEEEDEDATDSLVAFASLAARSASPSPPPPSLPPPPPPPAPGHTLPHTQQLPFPLPNMPMDAEQQGVALFHAYAYHLAHAQVQKAAADASQALASTRARAEGGGSSRKKRGRAGSGGGGGGGGKKRALAEEGDPYSQQHYYYHHQQQQYQQQQQQQQQLGFQLRNCFSNNPRLTMLLNALSSRVRHFALFEWFYSTIDRDYFNQSALQERLEEAGLGHLQHLKLTRTEWSAVRASLGRPRRLSPMFLYQERVKLENYRNVVRGLQQGDLSAPPPDFLYEVPARLMVGQTVSAYHKRAKLLARGQILTVDYTSRCYRVQFERAELGSEICLDNDIAVLGAPMLLFPKPRPLTKAISTAAATTATATSLLLRHHRATTPAAAAAAAAAASLLVRAQAVQGQAQTHTHTHTHTQPEGEGKEDEEEKQAHVKLMIFVIKMLERKEALLMALQESNEQADMAIKGEPSPALAVTTAKTARAAALVALNKTTTTTTTTTSTSTTTTSSLPSASSASASAGGGGGGAVGSGGAGTLATHTLTPTCEYSSIFKQQYAWVVNALERTNAALNPALERLQQVVGCHHQEGGEGEGEEEGEGKGDQGNQQDDEKTDTHAHAQTHTHASIMELYHGVRVSAVVRETIEKARAEATAAFQHHKAAKVSDLLLLGAKDAGAAEKVGKLYLEGENTGAADSGGPGSVQGLIEAGAAVLLTLRRCAEERDRFLQASVSSDSDGGSGGGSGGGAIGGGAGAGAGQEQGHMTAMDVEQCVGAAVQELKRRLMLGIWGRKPEEGEDEEEERGVVEEKLILLQEIEASIEVLKNELMM